MPKSSKTVHKEFIKKLKFLDNIRKNFERAFSAGSINETDITQGYAGLYLDVFTDFENLIENLFISILMGKMFHADRTIQKKIYISPSSETENILLGGKSFFNWLPYDNTLKIAKMYFLNGKPFTNFQQAHTDSLDKYHKIRNSIAHKSKKALKEFQPVINGLILLPHEKTPQGYLRYIPNPITSKTQFEIICDDLKVLSNVLCH